MTPAGAPGSALRALQPEDLERTAALHARELPEGFFARLGSSFLMAYHDTYRTSPFAVGLVHGPVGQVAGFAVAALRPAAHARWVLRRRGLRLAVLGLRALLLRPGLLLLFVRTRLLRYGRGVLRRLPGRTRAAGGQAAAWAVLSHIAVDPDRRGAGTGKVLVDEVRRQAERSGAHGLVLLTAPTGPGPGFYRRLGFQDDGLVRGADHQTWHRFRLPLR